MFCHAEPCWWKALETRRESPQKVLLSVKECVSLISLGTSTSSSFVKGFGWEYDGRRTYQKIGKWSHGKVWRGVSGFLRSHLYFADRCAIIPHICHFWIHPKQQFTQFTSLHQLKVSPRKKHNTTFSNLAVNYFHLSECALPRGPLLAGAAERCS